MDTFDVLKLENQLCFPLYAAAREVIKQYRPFLDALDLTYTQYITMLVLWSEGKISVRDLGRKLFLDSGTLTPVLKSLEGKGFIRRYRSPKDERVRIAVITESGSALKNRAVDVPGKVGLCIPLSPEEAMQLYQLLYKVLNGLQDIEVA